MVDHSAGELRQPHPARAGQAFGLEGQNPWHTSSTVSLFEHPLLQIMESRVVQPDGNPGSYVYVQLRGFVVVVVPVSEDDRVCLVRQWRYPWARNSWEVPAGHGEDGESPLQSAIRELAEETGYGAAEWIELGTVYGSAAAAGTSHIFLARGLTGVASPGSDPTEADLISEFVSLTDAFEAASNGTIMHSLSVVGLLRAWSWLHKQREAR